MIAELILPLVVSTAVSKDKKPFWPFQKASEGQRTNNTKDILDNLNLMHGTSLVMQPVCDFTIAH
jgi:hypothetical protein